MDTYSTVSQCILHVNKNYDNRAVCFSKNSVNQQTSFYTWFLSAQ
jgi:hypothetical protein